MASIEIRVDILPHEEQIMKISEKWKESHENKGMYETYDQQLSKDVGDLIKLWEKELQKRKDYALRKQIELDLACKCTREFGRAKIYRNDCRNPICQYGIEKARKRYSESKFRNRLVGYVPPEITDIKAK